VILDTWDCSYRSIYTAWEISIWTFLNYTILW
jgi:hypothetical protein